MLTYSLLRKSVTVTTRKSRTCWCGAKSSLITLTTTTLWQRTSTPLNRCWLTIVSNPITSKASDPTKSKESKRSKPNRSERQSWNGSSRPKKTAYGRFKLRTTAGFKLSTTWRWKKLFVRSTSQPDKFRLNRHRTPNSSGRILTEKRHLLSSPNEKLQI